MSRSLSLMELESFDPRNKRFGNERRFCCLQCGTHKPRDTAHQSLALNIETGVYTCHRCKITGLITEKHTKPTERRKIDRLAIIKKQFALVKPTEKPKLESKPIGNDGLKLLKAYATYQKDFSESLGTTYLESRSIPEPLGVTCGCGYAPSFAHWQQTDNGVWEKIGEDQRVVFPLVNKDGQLIAISARAITESYIEPKVKTRGPKSEGVFATNGALQAEKIVITEAPIDSMTVALTGLPSIALCGTSWPEWILKQWAFKNVVIAFDADEAGDKAASKLTAELQKYAVTVRRIRPQGAKDWNELLLKHGLATVKAQFGIEAASDGYTEQIAKPIPENNPSSEQVYTHLPRPENYRKIAAIGQQLASVEQCCSLLNQISAALAVVMIVNGSLYIVEHKRHPISEGLEAELQAHGTAIARFLISGRLSDNYCPTCGSPLFFEYSQTYQYVRAICSIIDGCGNVMIYTVTSLK